VEAGVNLKIKTENIQHFAHLQSDNSQNHKTFLMKRMLLPFEYFWILFPLNPAESLEYIYNIIQNITI